MKGNSELVDNSHVFLGAGRSLAPSTDPGGMRISWGAGEQEALTLLVHRRDHHVVDEEVKQVDDGGGVDKAESNRGEGQLDKPDGNIVHVEQDGDQRSRLKHRDHGPSPTKGVDSALVVDTTPARSGGEAVDAGDVAEEGIATVGGDGVEDVADDDGDNRDRVASGKDVGQRTRERAEGVGRTNGLDDGDLLLDLLGDLAKLVDGRDDKEEEQGQRVDVVQALEDLAGHDGRDGGASQRTRSSGKPGQAIE